MSCAVRSPAASPSGTPVAVVSALLGHALPGTKGLYVHVDRVSLRKAMDDVWGDFQKNRR